MSVELELKRIADRMEQHEKRHVMDITLCHRHQDACSRKFEKLFAAIGDNHAADAEQRARLNGFERRESFQDRQIEALGKKMDRWFIGLIVVAAVGIVLQQFVFPLIF